MIETQAVIGIAALAGVGGFLLGVALWMVGRLASPPSRVTTQTHWTATARATPNTRAVQDHTDSVKTAQPDAGLPVARAGEKLRATAGPSRLWPQAARISSPITARRIIRPIDRPYWEIKGWRADGNELRGWYQVKEGRAQGLIRQYQSRRPEFFIIKPPRALKNHSHWACFGSRGSDRYAIHFSPAPPNPDAGIREVEKVLAEALSA